MLAHKSLASTSRAQRSSSRSVMASLRWLIVPFVSALVWRGVALWQISRSWFFEFHIGDAAAYHNWALEIARGDWLGQRVFYQTPLYPYVLGGLYAVLGESRLGIAVIQCLWGAVSATFLADAGRRWFSPRCGLIAGLGLAVYAPAIFSDLLIQKSSLDLLLVCSLLWLMSRLDSHPRRITIWSLGVIAGLLVLNRENAILIAAGVGVWMALRSPVRGTGALPASAPRLATLLMYVVGVCSVLTPVVMRNRAVGGEWVLTTAQFGPNLYIGNHPAAPGTYVPLAAAHGDARYERQDAERLAERDSGRKLTSAEVSRYWANQAWRYMTTQPVDWGRLMLRKLALFWNHVELTDTEDVYTYAESAITLRWPGAWLNFGVLAICAVPGAISGWPKSPAVRMLCGFVLIYMTSVVLFYVVARYRLPAVPPLLLLAALGVTDGLPQLWRSPAPRRIAGLIALAAMGGLTALPLVNRDHQQTGTYLNFGAELLDRGRAAESVEQFRHVLAISPEFVEAHYNLGRAYVALGRLPDAAICFQQAVRLDPQFAEAWLNFANAALDLNRIDQALEAYEVARSLAPDDDRVWFGLGIALAVRGDTPAAVQALERAVQLAPDYAPAREYLQQLRTTPR